MATKINHLLQVWPPRTVATQTWLNSHGIDRRLADKYVRSGWLERFGHGAYVRLGSDVTWVGAVHALQKQLRLDLHPGAMTAFELRGYAHYIPLGERVVTLFGGEGTALPAWFEDREWAQPVKLLTTRVFGGAPPAVSSLEVDGVMVSVATLELAAFELMYLVPRRQSWEGALQVMESLTALRPRVVQELLQTCTSIKTKRLFMHAAERFEHPWLEDIDISRVDFGSGPRTIHPGGRLNKAYDLVIEDPNPDRVG